MSYIYNFAIYMRFYRGLIFGKVVQLKKGVTIDRDRTSVNLNEKHRTALYLVQRLTDMPTGWICGQTARDFVKTKDRSRRKYGHTGSRRVPDQ